MVQGGVQHLDGFLLAAWGCTETDHPKLVSIFLHLIDGLDNVLLASGPVALVHHHTNHLFLRADPCKVSSISLSKVQVIGLTATGASSKLSCTSPESPAEPGIAKIQHA